MFSFEIVTTDKSQNNTFTQRCFIVNSIFFSEVNSTIE